MDGPSSTPGAALDVSPEAPPIPAEPRQRWRIVVAREPVPPDRVGRVALDAWHACLASSGLPIAGLDVPGGRARLAIGAPLPAGARGAAELLDLWLLERLPAWQVREALAAVLPDGFTWVDAEDVWLGAPPLPGQVAGADWWIEVGGAARPGSSVEASMLADAAARLLAARSLPRTRLKAGAEKPYDLRPLIVDLAVEPGPPVALAARTRIDPELGSGRPEEIVAALAEAAGVELEIRALVRTRLLFADDLRP